MYTYEIIVVLILIIVGAIALGFANYEKNKAISHKRN